MNIIIVDDLDDAIETPEQRKERIKKLEENFEKWAKYYFPIPPPFDQLPANLQYNPTLDILTFPRDPDLAAKQKYVEDTIKRLKEQNPDIEIITPA